MHSPRGCEAMAVTLGLTMTSSPGAGEGHSAGTTRSPLHVRAMAERSTQGLPWACSSPALGSPFPPAWQLLAHHVFRKWVSLCVCHDTHSAPAPCLRRGAPQAPPCWQTMPGRCAGSQWDGGNVGG